MFKRESKLVVSGAPPPVSIVMTMVIEYVPPRFTRPFVPCANGVPVKFMSVTLVPHPVVMQNAVFEAEYHDCTVRAVVPRELVPPILLFRIWFPRGAVRPISVKIRVRVLLPAPGASTLDCRVPWLH